MSRVPSQRTTITDAAEKHPLDSLPLIRRRRPAGGPQVPLRLGIGGWAWLLASAAVLVTWVMLFTSGRPAAVVERLDAAILEGATALRGDALTSAASVVALLGSIGLILGLRWGAIAVLAFLRRDRHLVTFVGAVLFLRVAMSWLVTAVGRPRPFGIEYLVGWEGYAHPSPQVAALAVTLAGIGHALIPAGRPRRRFLVAAGALVVALGLARVYLGVDHPTDALFGAIAGGAVGVLAFRIFCPEAVFPVSYRRGRAAHIEIDERRERAIREALDEQAGLELVGIEPFGEDASGGSAPLRLTVRRSPGEAEPDGASENGRAEDAREEMLFGKLYSATHLRADRWYKLLRTVLYGALEDEFAFNSVRQLVEHEDYMLRVMREAGVPGVEPRGFLEIEPEREYLILMTFLERAEEADEDASIDAAVLDEGLRVVRTLWDHGLAHRDIKPGNVLVRDGRVYLIDVAFGQVRPSPWRQAVDLANMMLVLSLGSDPRLVYERATRLFDPAEIGEAFAAARGPAIPRELRRAIGEDERDLLEEFRRLAPEREPIAIQRWTLRRMALTLRTLALVGTLGALLVVNLANPRTP